MSKAKTMRIVLPRGGTLSKDGLHGDADKDKSVGPFEPVTVLADYGKSLIDDRLAQRAPRAAKADAAKAKADADAKAKADADAKAKADADAKAKADADAKANGGGASEANANANAGAQQQPQAGEKATGATN